MKVLCLGDVHNNFEPLYNIVATEKPDLIIQVGDFYELPELQASSIPFLRTWSDKLWSIYGNHDSDEAITPRLEVFQEIQGLKIAGLSGVYMSKHLGRTSSKYWKAADLITLSNLRNVDIFVSHLPFQGMGVMKRRKRSGERYDVGISLLTTVVNHMQPTVFLSGHHHKFKLSFYNKTIAMSLPPPKKGYAMLVYDNLRLRDFYVVLRDKKKEVRL